MRPLKIGVQLPEVEREVRWPEYRDLARLVEDAGFDSIWLGDHLLYRNPDGSARGPWEAFSMLAAIAAVTERVELGPLVASTAFHSPVMMAKKAVTIDEISGGRFILGIGAGWNEIEFRGFGFPYDYRASRFEEAAGVIRRLLAGERVDHDSRFYRIEGGEIHPAGPRPGGPPVMVGSMGERVLAATLPWVDAWNSWFAWYGNTVAGLRDLLARLDGACERAGRDPATLQRTVAVHVAAPGARGRVYGAEEHSGAEALPGPVERIAEHLEAVAGLGVAHVQLVIDPIDASGVEWAAGILGAL